MRSLSGGTNYFMWKCIICGKENVDDQIRCMCGFDKSMNYEKYFTIAKLDAESMEQYEQQFSQNKNGKDWMDWTVSVKKEIESMDESLGKELVANMKKYYESLVKKQHIPVSNFVATFTIGESVASDICSEEIQYMWQQINENNLPEDQRWNLEGNCWYFGVGKEKNYKKAVDCYIKSAKLGNFDALNNLGNCYFYGKHLPQNYNYAAECYMEAAESGNAIAQYNLAYCYQNAKGVEYDDKKAFELFKKADEKNVMKANKRLKYYYRKAYLQSLVDENKQVRPLENKEIFQIGVKKLRGLDKEAGLKMIRFASNHGLTDADYVLGYCYEQGIGVAKDMKAAQGCYWQATQGDKKYLPYRFDMKLIGKGLTMASEEGRKLLYGNESLSYNFRLSGM